MHIGRHVRACVATIIVAGVLSSQASVEIRTFDARHAAWTELLQRHVTLGVVDYAGIESQDAELLGHYLGTLGAVTRDVYTQWERNDKLAFCINLYNAFTVKLILDHYPLDTIRSIGLLPGAAFRDKFILLLGLRDEPYSLIDVEHEVLRNEFNEPRIHFAIVCASKSCPALRSEAYRGSELEAQLDEAARTFLHDPAKNRVADGTLHLSSIFKWFDEDFEKSAGSVEGFVRRYLDLELSQRYQIEYIEYDWSLNGR